uniref:C2 domain-containing protein n=1 Tax=Latimeria chalumnae TaxID=7897 RepID=H2ZSU5_LATCH
MHLSLKGSPLTERTGVSPSCCVSYATADCSFPVTTAVIENMDSPVWDHQQQARLSKELLLDPQQTLVFKVWHKADVERVIGFASVDLSPLLSGFQSVCGWYNISDFHGNCQGQIKVAVTPLESVLHLREQRRNRDEPKAPESSGGVSPIVMPFSYQTSATYTSFPCHITRYSEQLINTSYTNTAVLNPDSVTSPSQQSQASRHEEHVENIRRFHKSLQQAERNLHSAGDVKSLSYPSQSSLFTALRRNLTELDEIQRYFSRKLTSSSFLHVDDSAAPWRNQENGSDHQASQSTSEDTDECHLLERSNKLVFSVNQLIGDIQLSNQDAFSHGETSKVSSINTKALERAQAQEHERREIRSTVQLFEQEEPQMKDTEPEIVLLSPQQASGKAEHHVLSENERSRHAEDSCSEEEDFNEEDIVQPRMLNEVTVMTDRTSPWSSMSSEAEKDPEPHLKDVRK